MTDREPTAEEIAARVNAWLDERCDDTLDLDEQIRNGDLDHEDPIAESARFWRVKRAGWQAVLQHFPADSDAALGVLLGIVRAAGVDDNGEQTIELHIGADGFGIEVHWFDEYGGDSVEYWPLAEALLAALEPTP